VSTVALTTIECETLAQLSRHCLWYLGMLDRGPIAIERGEKGDATCVKTGWTLTKRMDSERWNKKKIIVQDGA